MVIQTGCSASLVALHECSSSIANCKEVTGGAIVGGTNFIMDPATTAAMAEQDFCFQMAHARHSTQPPPMGSHVGRQSMLSLSSGMRMQCEMRTLFKGYFQPPRRTVMGEVKD
jgi:hypothetical protein